MKRLIALALVAGFLVAIPVSQQVKADPTKGTHKQRLCHVPPGNPGNGHVISVSQKAVATHFAHGDCFTKEKKGETCKCKK